MGGQVTAASVHKACVLSHMPLPQCHHTLLWKRLVPHNLLFRLNSQSVPTFLIYPSFLSISRYKSSLFPGNTETLTILNTSPMVVDVFFSFQNDVKASTYFLEPVNMILKPNEKQVQSHGNQSTRARLSWEIGGPGILSGNVLCFNASIRC